jgi:plasmid stabilization system protein ParE
MKDVLWSTSAQVDLVRLHDFVASVNPLAAARLMDQLTAAPERLREHPRLGRQLERYAPRDVRRLIVGNYELQYELRHDVILVLRIWHGREDR